MIHKPIKGGVQEEKKLENLTAENEKLRSMLEYVALMNDIEIPEEGGSDAESTETDA